MPSSVVTLPARPNVSLDAKVTVVQVYVIQATQGNGYEVDGYVNPGYSGPID